jgi:hypothetical protein
MAGRSFSPEGLVVGLGLVTLGVLWLLANLGRLELLPLLRTWWPLALVVWGVLELAEFAADRNSRRS